MSVAACGGGMGGSDDEEKDIRKKLAEFDLGFAVSNKEDDDKKEEEEEDEITTKTKLYRQKIVLRRLMRFPRKSLSKHYPGQSRSFPNLKEINITDATELKKTKHPFKMTRRRLGDYVQSPLSKMTRAAVLDQDDDVEDDARAKKKHKGDDSKNQEDGK